MSPTLRPASPRALARLARLAAWLAGALVVAGCTITLPQRALVLPSSPAAGGTTQAQYRDAVAQRILDANASSVLHGTPQAMLRSLVVVAFTVDRDGRLLRSSVYRSNGDDGAEAIALQSLRRAAPLPKPPAPLLDGHGQLDMMESWLFNDNGQFQLRTKATQQAQTID
ncbi:energy transducer TonB family protein [Burkholderia plantarii]|uniref:energy transducer TonB family protein n=1 Tax=Burkholderia plantarii TaxID=41899 RepID=UPI0006D89D8F|nr:energy transducer TonB [Burkholderia plantarii]ALK29643.1 Putative lipoprotein [Burkholderia plantarii]GLZ20133.1 lipoprotein [Burkholderia plantarii]